MRTILGQCPRCRETTFDERPLRTCHRCEGHWVPEELLHERIEAMRAAGETPRAVDWIREARAALPCAICTEPMETMILHDVAVDRCIHHGVWLDKGELEIVLLRTTLPVPPRRKTPRAIPAQRPVATYRPADANDDLAVGIAVDTAFVAPELAVEAGAGALEAAAGVAEVAGGALEVSVGILEGIADFLAGLFV